MFVLLAKVLRTCDFVMAAYFGRWAKSVGLFAQGQLSLPCIPSHIQDFIFLIFIPAVPSLLVFLDANDFKFSIIQNVDQRLAMLHIFCGFIDFAIVCCPRFAREQLRAPCILTQQLQFPCDSPAEADVQKAQNVAQHHSDLLSKK